MERDMMNDIEEVLFTKEDISTIVKRLGSEITRDYAGKKLLLICVLKGAVVFLSDLIREIKLPLTVEFLSVSSYGAGTVSSGVVRVAKDQELVLKDYHVLVAEDILDSGRTLSKLLELFRTKEPASLAICTLFDKPARHQAEVPVAYVGAEVPDAFIVGYGLDYNEHYRNLPFIGVLKPEVYGG